MDKINQNEIYEKVVRAIGEANKLASGGWKAREIAGLLEKWVSDDGVRMRIAEDAVKHLGYHGHN